MRSPKIDPARIVQGSEWQKNRATDQGQPPRIVVVDDVVTVADVAIVHYRYRETGKRRSMPLADFCQGSEHCEPRPYVEPPALPTIDVDVPPWARALHAKLDELLAASRRTGPQQLKLPT
jgi:hypothetical protein